MNKYTVTEMKRISHALGVDLEKIMFSNLKQDKIKPDDFYRNYYQTNGCEIFDGLVEKGLALYRTVFGSGVYHLTDKGIEKYLSEWGDWVFWEPKAKRNRAYISKRIELYCKWYEYRFGDDNAAFVFKAYESRYSKKEYVSHTARDITHFFRVEIRTLLKLEKDER